MIYYKINEILWHNSNKEYYIKLYKILSDDNTEWYEIYSITNGIEFHCFSCKTINNIRCICDYNIWNNNHIKSDLLLYGNFTNINIIFNQIKDELEYIKYLSRFELCAWLNKKTLDMNDIYLECNF